MFWNKKKEQKEKFKSLELAICTLLIHAAKADGEFEDQEKKLIRKFLVELDIKDENYLDELIDFCIKKEEQSIEILNMTKEIKKLKYEERLYIIELVVKIIYSDQQLCHFEDRLLRKISGLIYIEDQDLGIIKKKIKNDVHR